jgi:hypothetical protein
MPDLTKLAACSADMVGADAEAILWGMRVAFPRESNSMNAEGRAYE